MPIFPMEDIEALIKRLKESNEKYSEAFTAGAVVGRAAAAFLLLTCMDSRIVPHAIFGLKVGDMKVIRNAGAQLNPEVIKDIILATHLLNCQYVIIMPHTQCAMATRTLQELQGVLSEESGMDFSTVQLRVIEDPIPKLLGDVETLRNHPRMNPHTVVVGALYDVTTGLVRWV